jgi:hypothetical protein
MDELAASITFCADSSRINYWSARAKIIGCCAITIDANKLKPELGRTLEQTF